MSICESSSFEVAYLPLLLIGTLPGGYGYVSPPIRVSSPGISCVCPVTKSAWIAILMVRCFDTFASPYLNTINHDQQSALSISRTGKCKQQRPVFPLHLSTPFPVISIIASFFRYKQLPSCALTFSHPRKHSVLKPTWDTYLTSARTLLLVGNMLFIVGDTFSACAMAYHLTKFKSWAHALPRSQPHRIDFLLNRLLIFAVATGALTSCVLFSLFCSHLLFDRLGRVLGRIALTRRYTGS